ncbi:chemotaxis protein CheA [Sessilibacter sp. MAH1]
MSIDLKQFHQAFFDESYEGLDSMEQSLLALSDEDETDPELINTIFRAAHSIKGGSATLGFGEIASFTHVLETLLDEVREGQRKLTAESIDLLLQSCDALRAMVHCLEQETPIDVNDSKPLLDAFEAMLNDSGQSAVSEPQQKEVQKNLDDSDATVISSAQDAITQTFFSGDDGEQNDDHGEKRWKIVFKPEPQILLTGNEPLRIFRELESMGDLEVHAHTDQVPNFDQITLDECFIHWTLFLTSNVDQDEIKSAFDWVLDECDLDITLSESGDDDTVDTDDNVNTETRLQQDHINLDNRGDEITAEDDYGESASDDLEFVRASASVVAAKVIPEKTTAKKPEPSAAKSTSAKAISESKAIADKKVTAPESAQSSTTSIRVGIDKVDNLINLVGELVITQSMLSELGNNFDLEKLERLSHGLEQLKQNTRELQENVMRIRMLPISFAFNRFPRMIRDLSNKTGKKVDLIMSGEQTELDKTVMEQIGDPLVHLVRNAIDHGLEMPEERRAAGKNETGKIHLNAEHKGGNIVIKISDDGRGMDPEKIRAKAVEKGVIDAEAELSVAEIYDLIFEPGFSTAAEVSDLSGRGVGMDVVRRNIKALGGRIEIDSEVGRGTKIYVHLPLTLAILDGQLVRVGREVYIIPLVAIVESLQIKSELVNRVSGNMVLYRLREDNVPIIPIHKEFNIQADNTALDNALLVVVEGEGCKIGLLVDDLLAQQQVVIKSLETNYKRVDGISGATILGDGSVALILDIPGIITNASRSRRRNVSPRAA